MTLFGKVYCALELELGLGLAEKRFRSNVFSSKCTSSGSEVFRLNNFCWWQSSSI